MTSDLRTIAAALAVTAAVIPTFATAPKAAFSNLRCEYLTDPVGIDVTHPRLTWENNLPGITDPSALAVEISTSPDFSNSRIYTCSLPDRITLEIDSTPSTRYYWRVVSDLPGAGNGKSAPASFETGKFGASQWEARWIGDGLPKETEEAPVFRKIFSIGSLPESARAYISSLGYFVMTINGKRVGDHHMDPGFTGYDKRSLYVTHDITPLLQKGDNTVEVTLGNGFANCQSIDTWGQENAPWRGRPIFICQIEADGKTILATDDSWETALSPVIFNNIYTGDYYDARIKPSGWSNATPAQAPNMNPVAQSMPAIRPVMTLEARHLKSIGDTIHIYDLGKNIAGVCRLDVKGRKGTRIDMSHGELLKADGTLEQGNLNIYYHPLKEEETFQTDRYIIGADDTPESFQPQFTYHGFRFVELRSSEPIPASDINLTGVMMRTAIPKIGSFRCSNPLLNRIYDATMLSYEDNIHSIPTDCPQREKNGWTADGHVAIDLGLLNYDGITLYEKWMNDFADNQRQDGNIAGIIPSAGWGYGDFPGPVWDAGLFIIPTALYDYYGDPTAMRRLYPTMLKYMDWLKGLRNDEGIITSGIGDWLPYNTVTPTDFTSTVYAFADYKMMARICRILGEDPRVWEEEAAAMRRRINDKWFDKEKALYANGSQAAQAVALYWDVVPEEDAQRVARNLNDMVVANGYALDFGMLGTKTVLRMLTKYGYPETAYRMATRTEAPSWGYWTDKCGYTTLAETWTLSPEFRDASLNHVFFGDICAWMVNDIVGLNFDPEHPGFENIIISPNYMKDLDWAEAEYHSIHGPIHVRWERDASGTPHLTVDAPAGCTVTR